MRCWEQARYGMPPLCDQPAWPFSQLKGRTPLYWMHVACAALVSAFSLANHNLRHPARHAM
jgi:hypothetical protein